MIDQRIHFWPEKQKILGTGVSCIRRTVLREILLNWAGRGSKGAFVVTANAEILLWAKDHSEYRAILNKAQLVFADGFGLMPAYWWTKYWRGRSSLWQKLNVFAWWNGFPDFEWYPGRILVEDLCRLAERRKLRVFLLGGLPRVAERAAEILKKEFGVQVVGFVGPKDATFESVEEWDQTREKINSFRPHFLFVAFGHPKQEEWISRHIQDLEVGVAMGVGGTFDYIVGSQKKPNVIFERSGIEASWRFFTQPRRLGRVWKALVEFPLAVVNEFVQERS